MAAIFGNLGAYDDQVEAFADYADRCAAFMEANQIPADRRVNMFLATVGPKTYKLLKNLCHPNNPNGNTYAQLINVLTNHYEPRPIIIAERHKFWTAVQGEGEAIADFCVRLKNLAATCAFGGFLQEALRDRLVSGLHSRMATTQRRLLSERDLNFHQARERCIADELAGKANREHMGETPALATNRVGGKPKSRGPPRNRGPSNSNNQQSQPPPAKERCSACGKNSHSREVCRYKDAVCHSCGRKGHIRPVCSAKEKNKVNCVDSDVGDSDGESAVEAFGLYHTQTNKPLGTILPYKVHVDIDHHPIEMEIDTGATRSTVSETIYNTHLSKFALQDPGVTLYSYSGEKVPLLGKINVPVSYGQVSVEPKWLDLVVVKGVRPALFGRDWMKEIKLDWEKIFSVSEKPVRVPESTDFPPEFKTLVKENRKLFTQKGSGIKEFRATLHLKPNATPVFQKARPVPYSLVAGVDQEYDRLIKADVLFPVTHSAWASPVVHVPKSDGAIRVCGDYKGVNEQLEDDGYKLPNIQDMFALLSYQEGPPTMFSTLDLAGAFNQLLLDNKSSELLTLNTRRGLLSSKRLCFGIKTAPAQFQRVMEQILSGIQGVMVFIDDILVATKGSVHDHTAVLKEVFTRLAKYNVRLNGDKCHFFQDKLKYMGHMLSANGISPVEGKLDAIKKAERPQSVTQLRSFLGMVNFYGKFINNLASELHPLFQLLKQDTPWKWTTKCDEVFNRVKDVISSDQVLVHYDPNKELVLSVDASPYGVGAVLSHRMGNGNEWPIEYASRTLSPAESNYSQIEKEGLAIIFGIKKFHLFLYGRKFVLVTDHKPLTRIFGPKSNIPPLAAARMQRWGVLLSGYDYKIEFRKSDDNANADFFSRFPLQGKGGEDNDEYVFSTGIELLPITAEEVRTQVNKDKTLCKVLEYTLSGWPEYCQEGDLQPFWTRRDELSLEDGCLLWGRRVIIPNKLQERIMGELHELHPGICRMKALARAFVWWPGIDRDIEDRVRGCKTCINTQNSPKKVPLLLWPWCTEPWQRVHIDYAEFEGKHYLVVVDNHSKWLEVFLMNGTTAEDTIEALRSLFARYGFPTELVSDNGPQFRADAFQQFLKRHRVKQSFSPPYHPASNGLAERHVQTLKAMLKKNTGVKSDLQRLSEVLFHYRNIPHTTTGKTPSELFLKRSPRTALSLVKPSLQSSVEKRQLAAKLHRDGDRPRLRTFDRYQSVRVRSFRGGKERWIPATVVEVTGLESYVVRMPGNVRRAVHANHLIPDDTGSSESMRVKPSGESDVIPVGPGIMNPAPGLSDPIPQDPDQDSGGPVSQENEANAPTPPDSRAEISSRAREPPCASPGPGRTPVKVTRHGRAVKPPKRLDM
jgi:transposase InsO family protein